MNPTLENQLKETALITGGSSGIGYELAREFARNGHPVVVVAPDAGEIATVAAKIAAEFQIAVRGIAKDLTQPAAAQEIFDELSRDGVIIGVLVNNAGVGQRGHFWDIPIEKDIEMIRLNLEAVVRLTKLYLPLMIARRRGILLNTASVAGFEPGPLLAVYHASKAFVLSWSEALATELDGTGVTVTALCPGPVDTDFFPKADMLQTRAFQKANVMAPQEVAEAGYAAALRGERVIVPGAINQAMVAARRVLGESGQARKNEKYYEDVPVEEQKRARGDIENEAAARERE